MKQGECLTHGTANFRRLRDGFVCSECYLETPWSDDAWRHQEIALLVKFHGVEVQDI